ncbi:alpha/beta hydrolase fold-domain-containing protein [Exophiala viscosa]|uniref:Alpha/beta hydrolase fold-domain-containing protein n=1 Tax=Exophiala viscosa TaxID=2486360 RepID=A0AAN6I8X9_9EURO|nr:alpha/beta hydrolase fold-domain-containing protein [Exophiala viscosa]
MADYSDFGSPCEDWLNLTRDNAIVPPVPLLQTREQSRAFRAAGNEARYRASKEALSKLGGLGVSIQTVSILCRDFQEIGARIYRPSPSASSRETTAASLQDGDSCKVLLYFHGGGFLSGSLSTEDALCVQLANHGNVVVISVNYRHTPEWTYPTQFDDAWAARCQILHEPQTLGLPPNIALYVAGISSGANLAASLTVRERITDDVKIKGQALWMPWLCHPDSFPTHAIVSPEKSSPIQCRDAPLLSYSLVQAFAEMLQVDENGISDMIVNPLLCSGTVLERMPPTHILVCGNDPLRDHGMLFADKLDSAGVPVRSEIYPGLPHGFGRINGLKSNKAWDNDMDEGLQWLLQSHHKL